MSKARELLEVLNEAKVAVYDNGGKTIDRYTVIVGKDVYTMSDNPNSPQGANTYAGEVGTDVVVGSHLGKKVKVSKLPKEVQSAIKDKDRE